MFELSVAAKLTLALAVPTTFVLLYWLIRHDGDDDDADDASNNHITTSRQTVINIKVPKHCVGPVIGRQGANIKKIREESGARVHFQEENVLSSQERDERTVMIRGTSESAQKAEIMIRQIIADVGNPQREEMTVPAYSMGRIIGRNGETIRELQRLSQAKIIIERESKSVNQEEPRVITIVGSQQAIDKAKNLIIEQVQEAEVLHKKKKAKQKKSSKSEGMEQKTETVTSVPVSNELWDSPKTPNWPEKKDFIEVYVSAVEHPTHFWVQLLSEKSVQLDRLTDSLTEFYNTEVATENFQVPDAEVGSIVAAPFEPDQSWYRARVTEFDGDRVDLFYVDYGDSCWVDRKMLRKLKPEFLVLPYQAVECKLSNIKPKDDEWSDEAVEVFENLTHCAQWKVLVARTEHYETEGDHMTPCLHLYDTNGPEDIDINLELRKRGFAEETCEQAETTELSEVAHSDAYESVAASALSKHASDVI